jgi:DNA-binding transcriptional LysR family regulator
VFKIGLGEAIATRFLVEIINELKRCYPQMEVEFDVDLNAHLVRKLTRGAIDVALIGGPVVEAELKFIPIGAMPLAWVGAPSLFRGRSHVTPADVAAMPIISLPREARFFSHLNEWFAEAAVVPASVSYCNNLATMIHVARAGVSLCMVPIDMVAQDIAAGTLLAPTPVPPLPALKFFVTTRADSLDPVVANIAAVIGGVTKLPRPSETVLRQVFSADSRPAA